MNMLGNENDTFQYWGEYWLSKKRNKVCYSQYRNLKCYLNHTYDFIGNMPIKDIKPDNIDNLLDELTVINPNTNRPSSHQYLVNVRNVAYDVFEYAIDNDVIGKNPAKHREISKYAPKKHRRSLTNIEQKLILVTPHRARIGALIMMFAGLRKGELIPLTWDDIDLDNFRIKVIKSVAEIRPNHFIVKNGTKTTSEGRMVSIPLDLAIEIDEARKSSSSMYVCPKKDGTMQSPTSWQNMWKNYIKTIIDLNPCASSTDIKEITPHFLRHTYATLLYKAGIDVVTASKLMGHSNIKTTVNIYTHFDDMTVVRSVDKLDDYISQNLL